MASNTSSTVVKLMPQSPLLRFVIFRWSARAHTRGAQRSRRSEATSGASCKPPCICISLHYVLIFISVIGMQFCSGSEHHQLPKKLEYTSLARRSYKASCVFLVFHLDEYRMFRVFFSNYILSKCYVKFLLAEDNFAVNINVPHLTHFFFFIYPTLG